MVFYWLVSVGIEKQKGISRNKKEFIYINFSFMEEGVRKECPRPYFTFIRVTSSLLHLPLQRQGKQILWQFQLWHFGLKSAHAFWIESHCWFPITLTWNLRTSFLIVKASKKIMQCLGRWQDPRTEFQLSLGKGLIGSDCAIWCMQHEWFNIT